MRGGESKAWVSKLALGPNGVLHVLGSDGSLHGFDPATLTQIYTQQIATGDLIYQPNLAGMGATLVISETLFDARDGRRRRSHINGDRWAIQLGANGQRLLANSMTATLDFAVVDACGKTLRSFPRFTDTALPSFNTFDGGMLWTETLRSDDRLLIRTDDLGRERKRLAHYWGLPKLIGADGTIYAVGTPAGKAAVVALSEDLKRSGSFALPGGPPYSAAGLGSDGVLYLADDVGDT